MTTPKIVTGTKIFRMSHPEAVTYTFREDERARLNQERGPHFFRADPGLSRMAQRAGLKVRAFTAEITTAVQTVTANCR